MGQLTDCHRAEERASLRASWRQLACVGTHDRDLPCLYGKRVWSRDKQVGPNRGPGAKEGPRGDC